MYVCMQDEYKIGYCDYSGVCTISVSGIVSEIQSFHSFSWQLYTCTDNLYHESNVQVCAQVKIKVECSQRNLGPYDIVILDACSVLCIVPWPTSPAKVSNFVSAAVFSIMRHLDSTKVLHVVFGRCNNNSIKSCCHMQRHVYKLSCHGPLPHHLDPGQPFPPILPLPHLLLFFYSSPFPFLIHFTYFYGRPME